jgi:hypothetical protein
MLPGDRRARSYREAQQDGIFRSTNLQCVAEATLTGPLLSDFSPSFNVWKGKPRFLPTVAYDGSFTRWK